MRILLDTNVVIPLEDSSGVLADSLSRLSRLANENGHQLLIHPASLDDINRDGDVTRREISLSRVKKYSLLNTPPKLNDIERIKLNLHESSPNDHADNQILYAIFRNAANILVSEDRGLHKKAVAVGIGARVHYIQQATSFLERLHAHVSLVLPNIEELALHEIDVSISFFDSLRTGYPGFDDWYREAARSGRRAWVHRDDHGSLGAINVFKEEIDPIVTDDNRALPGKVLKLCTFKVGESVRGRKIGELLLKASFRYATNNYLTHIYITMKPNGQGFLQDLCEDFGFCFFGGHKGDSVYVKEHPANAPRLEIPPFDYHRRFYPHFRCDKEVQKFIVPIRPEFHAILFPDIQQQPSLFLEGTAGNAIKQAYLCHSRVGGISTGDLVLFYRSRDQRAITSVGIVEETVDSTDRDQILEMVSKRTVYSSSDITAMARHTTKVILFRLAIHLQKAVDYGWMKQAGVVKGQIQTIRRINHESFQRIADKWEINNCIHAD